MLQSWVFRLLSLPIHCCHQSLKPSADWYCPERQVTQSLISTLMFLLRSTYRFLLSTELKYLSKRGVSRHPIALAPGERVKQFSLKSIDHIRSLDLKVYNFTHPEGLRYCHLDSSDIQNTFAIIVGHTPANNKGVACVLEMMLQCGDNKYRVKDVVEEMKNRSFNQTNGVETTEDYFLFPFRSKSVKDFHQLMDVYLNMAFNPRLQYSDFLQSRGHFKLKDNSVRKSLSIQGGLYAHALLQQQLVQGQVQQVTRKYFLGKEFTAVGKSNEVVSLDYQSVVDYHRQHFTQNNTVLYSHGDISPVKHIQAFSEFIFGVPTKPPSEPQPVAHTDNLPQTAKIVHSQGSNNFFVLSFKIQAQSLQELIQLNILSCLLFDFPESTFSKNLSLETPYPKFYGFRQYCFNIGFTTTDPVEQRDIVRHQKQIIKDLEGVISNQFDDGFIEAVLNNLQSSFYDSDGLTLLHSIATELTSGTPFLDKLNLHPIFRKLHRDYRRKNIFESLIQKHLLSNSKYLRIYGQSQKSLPESLVTRNQFSCIQKKKLLSQQELVQIANFTPTQQIQNPNSLPMISSTDYQFPEESSKTKRQVRGVKVTFVEGAGLSEIVVKIDVSDIEEQHLNSLLLFCKILPRLGGRNTQNINYDQFINKYIADVSMEFDTVNKDSGLKLFMFLKVRFVEYNTQYAFNLLNNCLNHPNFENLSRISEIVMAESSNIYNDISENLVLYGASYACSQMNPFLKLQDKLFHARSFTGVQVDIIKVANPKFILQSISGVLRNMHQRISQRTRYEVFMHGGKDSQSQMGRYLEILLDGREGQPVESIQIEGFTPNKIKSYFPNFKEGLVFEAFPVPYLKQQSPVVSLLGSMIHQNIRRHNKIGGCFVYKGGLVTYLKGNLKQFLELQKVYQNVDDVEAGKRNLFQKFGPHTAFQQFKHGLSSQFVRHYKQAILATKLSDISHVLNKFVFQSLKQEESSQVSLGPHLSDYTHLLKSGWTVERILEGMSLGMQSNSTQQIGRLSDTRDINIV